jgi:hypothetical protein
MTKVGLLIPISNIRPLFTKELFSGIKKAYAETESNPEFHNENIGLGIQPSEIIEKAQNLLLYKEVDVIYALVGHQITAELIKIVKSYNKKLVLIDFGTNSRIEKAVLDNPDIVSSVSFGLSTIYWHLGYYASLNLGKKALVSSDFFHSGFPFASAFESGFTQNGGEIVGYHICQNDDDELASAGQNTFKKAEAEKADLIFANYTYSNIDSILKASKKSPNLALMTSCLSLPENNKEDYPNIYVGGLKYFIDLQNEYPADSWIGLLAFANTKAYLNSGTKEIPLIVQIQKGWSAQGFTDTQNEENVFLDDLKTDEPKTENTITSGWTNPYLCI